MSMINFMNYSLSTAAEGFVPSHAPLKNNKHLNILFSQLSWGEEKNKSESQGLTPSSWVCACGTRRGSWGRGCILSVMPNVAPDTLIPLNRSSRQKINEETQVLNDTLEQTGLIFIYKTFYLKASEYTFFSSAHWIFSGIDHILGHKPTISEFNKVKSYQASFLITMLWD